MNNTKLSKRLPNWEQDDKNLLSQLVLEKLEIIENAKIDTNTNKKKRDAWNSIGDLFNKVSKTTRNIDQLQNQWRKTKTQTRSRNSAYMKQIKQTGGGPQPKALSSFDEELTSRLPKQFEQDYNIFDSNSSAVDKLSPNLPSNETYSLISDDEILEEPDGQPSNETSKSNVVKNKRNDKCNETSKRIKLLDVSIKQKELEMEYTKKEFKTKIITLQEKEKAMKLQMEQMKEEHELKIEKLKLEMHNVKKSGFFT